MKFLEYISKNTEIKIDNKITLKEIFTDNWDNFLKDNPDLIIRDVVKKEVNKIMSCRCMSEGYSTYICENCGELKYIPFTCKSRFCPSCGINTIIDRTETILKKLVKSPHRHIIFTIPEELRPFFMQDRKTFLNILFEAVSDTLNYVLCKGKKSEKYRLGFISTLHTFGRDLKWNPHIHVLLSEFITGKTIIYKKIFTSYKALRKSFQYTLLKKMEKVLGVAKFRAIKNKLFLNYKEGFYVYAKPNVTMDTKESIKYIIRYSCRPAIAESRIVKYENNQVTFWYDRHEDGKRVLQTMHVYDFIKALIIHIPEENFNVIRYYGFYSKPLNNYNKLFKLVSDLYFKARNCLKNFRNKMKYYFSIDPHICPKCNKLMQLYSITLKDKTKIFNTC